MTAVIAWLDRTLGRLTMYRLVLVALAVLTVEALVLGATGVLFYSAPAMLAGVAVLLAASWGSNRLLGLAFRIRPHSESALITAGLLFFIMPPVLTPDGLLVLAGTAAIANASKYLIAVRGRHLLNPAAVGALVVGILGLGYSAWWVANPWMLPLVALTGLLVLFRTRRLPLALLFVAVATLALVARYALSGFAATPAALLELALVSSPTVFFAAFMLSEPLTLPPRRWQQLLEAAVVGVLFAVPFSLSLVAVGPLSIGVFATPELWLVLGNLLAFAFARRRGIRLAYTGRRQLTPTSWEFEFAPDAPVPFAAGQYLELTLPHRADSRGWRRTFSIASAPGGPVRLGLRVPPERSSSFKRTLLELEQGTVLRATGVGGDFTLPTDAAEPLLLVAGGIGITPFVSQLGQLAQSGDARDVVVVYAVSSSDDIAYAVELGRAGVRVLLVAPDAPTRLPEHWEWLGFGPLTSSLLLAAVPDARTRRTYLSGPPSLIAALRPGLAKAGVGRIHTDAFIGY